MWVVLTRADSNLPVHVNMDLVTWMCRLPDWTEIFFGKDFSLNVKETPEQIRDRLASLDFEADPNENG